MSRPVSSRAATTPACWRPGRRLHYPRRCAGRASGGPAGDHASGSPGSTRTATSTRPDTTPSGNVWGMPFAMACGRGDEASSRRPRVRRSPSATRAVRRSGARRDRIADASRERRRPVRRRDARRCRRSGRRRCVGDDRRRAHRRLVHRVRHGCLDASGALGCGHARARGAGARDGDRYGPNDRDERRAGHRLRGDRRDAPRGRGHGPRSMPSQRWPKPRSPRSRPSRGAPADQSSRARSAANVRNVASSMPLPMSAQLGFADRIDDDRSSHRHPAARTSRSDRRRARRRSRSRSPGIRYRPPHNAPCCNESLAPFGPSIGDDEAPPARTAEAAFVHVPAGRQDGAVHRPGEAGGGIREELAVVGGTGTDVGRGVRGRRVLGRRRRGGLRRLGRRRRRRRGGRRRRRREARGRD